MRRVAVVGGGITGLTVAYRLARNAADRVAVTVLEASERPGGAIQTKKIDGFLCEHGPQAVLDNAPETLSLLRDLGLETVESSPSARKRYLYRAGKLWKVPDSPVSAVTSDLISWNAKLRLLAEPFMRAGTAGDETIHAFVARRLGREVAERLVDPMVSGIYAGDAARLSMRAAFPAIWELERTHGSLVRGMFAKRRQRANADPSQRRPGRLVSFADGLQALPEALARALGDRVRTRQEVIGIEPVTNGDSPAARWRISVRTGDVLEAEQIVIAGHPSRAASLAAPFDRELSALLESIPSAPVAVVALGFPRAAVGHPLDGFGFLVPRSAGLRTLGVLWESSIFPYRAPAGYVLLRTILGGAHDPAIVAFEDRELVAAVTGELQPALAVSAPPAFSYVVRHQTGIPQCTLGHTERMKRVDDALARWRGLHVTGWGYRGISINQGIAEATALAARLIAVQP